MNIQQTLLACIASILMTIFLYYLFMALFVRAKRKQYLYFSISNLGGSVFALTGLLLTYPFSLEVLLNIHRVRLLGVMLGTSAWFYCAYGIYFSESRIPKYYAIFNVLIAIFVPGSLFLTYPIHSMQIFFHGAYFKYHYGTVGPIYLVYSIILLLFFLYSTFSIGFFARGKVSKIFGIIAFFPAVIGGVNDFAVVLGLINGIMLSEYMFLFYLLSFYILFLKEKQLDYYTLQKLNLALEDEVKGRTNELLRVNKELRKKIEEHLDAEAKMKESKEFLDKIINSMLDCIVVGDQKGNIIRINNSLVELLGYPESEILGKHMMNFVPRQPGVYESTTGESIRLTEEFFKETSEIINALRTTGKLKNWITYFLRRDGKCIPFEVSIIFLYKKPGEIIASLGLMRDISERQREERLNLVSEKIASIGRIAGGISNEFEKLLGEIIVNLANVRWTLSENKEVIRFLDASEKALNEAENLTRKFITFATGGEPIKETIDLEQLLLEIIKNVLGNSGVGFIFNYNARPLWVEIDRKQISEVFKDILENARESMGDGGEVEVEVEGLTLDSQNRNHSLPLNDGKYLKILIRDRGQGIPSESLKKIFDPYFSTKLRGVRKGMGLGLSIAYSIIKKHDGFIRIESVEGEGTNVFIYLPANLKIEV